MQGLGAFGKSDTRFQIHRLRESFMDLKRQMFSLFCLVSLLLSGCTNPFAEDTVSTDGMCTGGDDSQSGMDEACTVDDFKDKSDPESDDLSNGGNQTSVSDENTESSTNDTVVQQNETMWQYMPTNLNKWNCQTYTSHDSLQNDFSASSIQENLQNFSLPVWCGEIVSQLEVQLSQNDSNFSQVFHHYGIEDTNPMSLRYDSGLEWSKTTLNVTEDDCTPDGQYNASEKNCVVNLVYSSIKINDEYILFEDDSGNWEIWRYEFVEEILIIGNVTALNFGLNPGDYAPNFSGVIHHYQATSWDTFQFHDQFDFNWSQGDEGKWMVVYFISTDCGHCWNSAEDVTSWHAQYQDKTDFLAMAVNFSSNNNFNATQSEIVAFQEKTSFVGCRGGSSDCSERPGDAHSFPYFDDRNQSVMYDWNVRGTPTYFIISPNGQIVWNQNINGTQESVSVALERFFGN